MQSPLLTRGQPDKGHKLFAREVIFDEPDALKSRSSSRLRVVNGQLIQCKAPAGTASNGPQDLQRSQPARYYIFETLISSTDRSRIWDQPQFWEDAFLDAVGRERDVIGLDHSAMPMLKKYSKLSQPEKKLLELKEDRILACLLHNMIAYMVMLRLPEQEIRTVTFRLLGRCRLGAYFSNLVFCQRVLTNEAELQAKLEALGPAEGVTFSGEEMFERKYLHAICFYPDIFDSHKAHSVIGPVQLVLQVTVRFFDSEAEK
ncbi:unnamed protein product [Schistocephalus solidus]|uniref:SBF2 domain-containing protein n=1 Tax=Schistocephalus solidus TaxID=70667 RepID=A0A183SGD7_SCHSO|nr:unnamed protein product [Schistocephalus solidus]